MVRRGEELCPGHHFIKPEANREGRTASGQPQRHFMALLSTIEPYIRQSNQYGLLCAFTRPPNAAILFNFRQTRLLSTRYLLRGGPWPFATGNGSQRPLFHHLRLIYFVETFSLRKRYVLPKN